MGKIIHNIYGVTICRTLFIESGENNTELDITSHIVSVLSCENLKFTWSSFYKTKTWLMI